MSYLAESKEINITHAAMLINKSWPTASKILAGLCEAETIELTSKRGRKHGSTKTYQLKKRKG